MMNGKIVKQSFREALYTLRGSNKALILDFVISTILTFHFFIVAYSKDNPNNSSLIIVCLILGEVVKTSRLFRGFKLLPMDDKDFHKFNILSTAFYWIIVVFLITLPSVIGLCVQGKFSVVYIPFACLLPSGIWSLGLINFKNYNFGIIHKIIDIVYVVAAILWLAICTGDNVHPLIALAVNIIIFAGYFFYHYLRIRKYTIDELNFEDILNSKSSILTGGYL